MEQESPSLSFLYLLSILLPGAVVTVAGIFIYKLFGGTLPNELNFIADYKTSLLLFFSFLLGLLIDRFSQQVESKLSKWKFLNWNVRKKVFDDAKRKHWKKDLLPYLANELKLEHPLLNADNSINYSLLNDIEHYVRYSLIKEGLHDNIEKDKYIYKLLRNLVIPFSLIFCIGSLFIYYNGVTLFSACLIICTILILAICIKYFKMYRFDYTLKLYQLFRFNFVINKK